MRKGRIKTENSYYSDISILSFWILWLVVHWYALSYWLPLNLLLLNHYWLLVEIWLLVVGLGSYVVRCSWLWDTIWHVDHICRLVLLLLWIVLLILGLLLMHKYMVDFNWLLRPIRLVDDLLTLSCLVSFLSSFVSIQLYHRAEVCLNQDIGKL